MKEITFLSSGQIFVGKPSLIPLWYSTGILDIFTHSFPYLLHGMAVLWYVWYWWTNPLLRTTFSWWNIIFNCTHSTWVKAKRVNYHNFLKYHLAAEANGCCKNFANWWSVKSLRILPSYIHIFLGRASLLLLLNLY